ncbi:DUF7112 family protein [Salinibaculum rarum]|uniref:DUF7112 family protein n=1 Tax=Salinibaculum rarum TaxID=3058903 RepID=UPI00265ED91C|nr:hypothetical protein [Salinibaculum sp. KK48]
MSDRVPSDHEAVPSHRTHRKQVGRTGRPRIPLPDALDVTVGDVIRLSFGGDTYHAQVTDSLDGGHEVRGAFFDAQAARTGGEGENHLQTWVDDAGLSVGDPLEIDVVTAGYQFGLRQTGERVVYEALDPPSSSLADIARDLGE